MAIINVDYSKLNSTASEIEKYTISMKNKMKSAQGEINNLSANWQGKDFIQFKAQWETVSNNDSTYYKMLKSLENYTEFLRAAAFMYKEAQKKAIDLAYSLPR